MVPSNNNPEIKKQIKPKQKTLDQQIQQLEKELKQLEKEIQALETLLKKNDNS